MKKIFYSVAVLISLSYFSACSNNHENANEHNDVDSTVGMMHDDSVETSQEKNDDKMIQDDASKFVTETASASMFEIEAAKLAEKNATSADVKKFAAEMMKDHKKASGELTALAGKKQISVPSSMSDEHKNDLEAIAKKTGKDFDEEYIDKMVSSHKDAVEDFESAAKDVNDQEVKNWASKMLPTLRHHLEMAQSLEKKMDNHNDMKK